MDKLLDQLIIRWEQAFDDIKNLPAYKAAVKTTQYAENTRYNLEKFDKNSFPSDGALSNKKQSYQYGFNDQGLPCYVAFNHDHNKLFWEGYYNYTDKLAEYIEFNINTGTPSAITRVIFENGRKVLTQRLFVNGGGAGYAHLKDARAELIRKYKENADSFFLTASRFLFDQEGKVIRSEGIHITPGIGKYTSHNEYTYVDNQLDKIKTFDANGNGRLTFSRNRDNLSQEALVEKLSMAMAQEITNTLHHQEINEPLALLELGYHYADNYLPLLGIQTQQQIAERRDKGELAFITDNYLDAIIDISSFEDLFAQMEQLMEEKSDMKIGRTTLTRAAAILTETKLFGKIKTTGDFAAFAIDWSIEGHSTEHLVEILLECGVKKETITKWKENKLLVSHGK
ncbi:hypothetical protein [Chitinophaga sancti]|uniref:hypothetical protein n=1 Tax=Chitinophaga sancti TaxID=1004 RepID=UPI003F79A35C